MPLSVVFHGIDREGRASPRRRVARAAAARVLRGRCSRRDLRALAARGRAACSGSEPAGDEIAADAGRRRRKRPSLSKHLDRAVDRLTRAAGRLDLPDAFRDGVTAHARATSSRCATQARNARGRGARARSPPRLPAVDAALAAIAQRPRRRRVARAGDAATPQPIWPPIATVCRADAWTRSDRRRRRSMRCAIDSGLPALDVAGL